MGTRKEVKEGKGNVMESTASSRYGIISSHRHLVVYKPRYIEIDDDKTTQSKVRDEHLQKSPTQKGKDPPSSVIRPPGPTKDLPV
jgi:hypothetical protein